MTHQPPHNPEWKGVVGIQNMGNTCYCNSTLQLIRACPEWTAFCLSQPLKSRLEHVPDSDSNKRMILAYQDILHSLWSAYRPAYVRPLGFMSEVKKAVKDTPYEMFGLPIQNDSHEYLVYLLDHFHEALKTKTPYIEKPISVNMTAVNRMRAMAENGWNKYESQNRSEIVQLFFGMMRKTVECSACSTRTYQWDVFNSLKIPCSGNNFYDWIRGEANEVTPLDGYQCDTCHGKQPATIRSHLWRLPQNLFITIRRFQGDGQKNMAPCPYTGENITFKEFYAEESDDPHKNASYEVRGVSDHHGNHMGGHYTAQFKHPITAQWWWYDDQMAQPLQTIQCSPSNYLFYFRRV